MHLQNNHNWWHQVSSPPSSRQFGCSRRRGRHHWTSNPGGFSCYFGLCMRCSDLSILCVTYLACQWHILRHVVAQIQVVSSVILHEMFRRFHTMRGLYWLSVTYLETCSCSKAGRRLLWQRVQDVPWNNLLRPTGESSSNISNRSCLLKSFFSGLPHSK